MELNILLVKSITLLFRESQLKDKSENSSDLVRTVISTIGNDKDSLTLKPKQILVNLKNTALEMCNSPIDHEFDRNDLLQRIKINCDGDEVLYEALKQGIEEDIPENQLKRNIVNLRKAINNHFKEQTIQDIINGASYELKFNRDKIKDMNEYIIKLIAQLEPLQLSNSSKDPAVINDIDIGDDTALNQMFSEIQSSKTSSRIYKTGWTAFNKMTQGGLRPGLTMMAALQHKYKTGCSLSLFAQIAEHNKPYTVTPGKKPLILRISFEDEIISNLQFLYQYLKYNETREYVDVENVSAEEMTMYVKSKLQANGFHVKMIRVDPTQWTYKSICNKVIELEAQGYEIEVLMLDYLAMVPTLGCINTGPMGTDMRDMFRRIRNFMAPRKSVVFTPHQLNTASKQMLRGGMPEDQFVKEINEKGMFSGSAQLDQECDLIFYIHLCKHMKETYITFQRDKHRLPTILPDHLKYFLLKFPKGMPIPEDRLQDDGTYEDSSFTKLPRGGTDDSEDLFSLG